MKIEEYDHAITQIQIVKAKCWIIPVPKTNIARITRNIAITVPNDLLMVCHRLASNICPKSVPFWPALFLIFSLILSKMIMVSLILYPILVSTAMINIVSTIIVLSIIIRIPYAQAGIDTSKIIVTIVIAAKSPGAISFLIVAKANIIYIAIKITQTMRAFFAVLCI